MIGKFLMEATHVITAAVECPHCGHNSPHALRALAVSNNVACASCGKSINLEVGNNAILIEELLKAAGRIDAALAKNGNLS